MKTILLVHEQIDLLLVLLFKGLSGLSGVLRVFRFRGAPVSEVASCPAPPVSPPPPGVPGAGCRAVVPAGPVPGQAPAGRDSVGLPGSGTLSGQTGFIIPLCPA